MMAASPLAKRNAAVIGVERPAGRRAAVALAEAGADVALITLSAGAQAEFAANSTANEFWAIGRRGVVLTTDGSEAALKAALADATAQLGPVSVLVYHAPAPLPRAALAGLRSDPAIVVLVAADAPMDEATALFAWTRELADGGLRANALVASRALADAAAPSLTEHHAPEPLDVARGAVYLASDALAAVEGALLVATG
jgi:NAD(P)-dependent dehydrogenase (short-subunit alcohol dehydrogenase family)